MSTWLDRQPDTHRPTLLAVDARIRAAMPGVAVAEAGGMQVYGPFRYRYATGREGDSALVSLAVRAGGVAIYVNSVRPDGVYVAEASAASLGKVKVGRSCVTVKQLAHLDLDAFERVVREAAALGGAGQVP